MVLSGSQFISIEPQKIPGYRNLQRKEKEKQRHFDQPAKEPSYQNNIENPSVTNDKNGSENEIHKNAKGR